MSNLVNLNNRNLPSLHELEVDESQDLAQSSYWSPQDPGEIKLCIFMGIEEKMQKFDDNEPELRRTAFFKEQNENNIWVDFENSAARLVGAMERATPGQAYKIEYLGRQKNKTNSNSSAAFKINPIRVKQDLKTVQEDTPVSENKEVNDDLPF